MLLVTYSSGFASHLAKVLRLREILLSSTPLSCPCWNFSNRWTLTHLEDPAQQAPSKKHSPRGPIKVADFSPCLPEHFLWILIIITYFMFVCSHVCFFPPNWNNSKSKTASYLLLFSPKASMQCWMNEWMNEQVLQFLAVNQGRTWLYLLSSSWGGRTVSDLCGSPKYWRYPNLPWDSIAPLLSHWNFDSVSIDLEIWRNSYHKFLWLLRIIRLLHHIIWLLRFFSCIMKASDINR